MDFSKRQDDPRRHLLGLFAVVAFHVLIVYALVNGLAKKVVDVVRAPIETKLIEEIVKPPPPPPPLPPTPPPPARVVAPPPRQAPPPPPFVPPPEVIVTAPPPMAPTITAVTPTPPPTHVEITPMPPPPIDPEPAPTKPAQPVAAAIVCTRMPPPVAPNVAVEVKGSLFVIGTLKNGRVVQVDIERNTLKGVNDRRTLRAFVSAVETAMKDGYVCAGDGVQIRQEFFFDIR
ncbi:MAG: energy transducer TonB [Rhizobacter sp.]